MNAKWILFIALLPMIGCSRPPAMRVDMSAATADHPAAAEYAPEQHAALSWDAAGLRCVFAGQANYADEVSISIRTEDSSRVLYLRFPLIHLTLGKGGPPGPVLATRIVTGQPVQSVALSGDEFRWLGGIGLLPGSYFGEFQLAWSALGYTGKPTDNLIIIVQKIERRPPGAIFTLNAAPTTQPGGK